MSISLRQLQVFRMLFCAGLFCAYGIARRPFSEIFASGSYRPWFHEVSVIFGFLPVNYFHVCWCLLLVSLAAAAIGLCVRWSLALAAVFSACVDSPLFSQGIYPMTDASFFVLVALWISAAYYESEAYSFPLSRNAGDLQIPDICLRAAHFILGAIYFNAFLNKIFLGGQAWLSGATLQNFFVARAVFTDNSAAHFVGQSLALCSLLAISTLIFEGLFLFMMFTSRTKKIFACLGLAFHLSTLVLFEVDFLLFYFPIYFAFVDWGALFNHKSESN